MRARQAEDVHALLTPPPGGFEQTRSPEAEPCAGARQRVQQAPPMEPARLAQVLFVQPAEPRPEHFSAPDITDRMVRRVAMDDGQAADSACNRDRLPLLTRSKLAPVRVKTAQPATVIESRCEPEAQAEGRA